MSGPSPHSLSPDALGPRFEVRGELGRGGMGVVYRAFDRQLGREVAVKLMLNATPQRVQRLVREGQAVANLSHPGIVRVHEGGTHDDKPFLVCELVEGARTLDQVLPELDLEQRIALVRDAAAALGAAHGVGVAHRDVKPENLLVDASGRLFVTDFGLALIEGEDKLTRTGAMLGTPHYMSPEQVHGRRDEQGPPSDVWSLGVVLYFALTDALPFTGENLGALAYAIANTPPASPSSLQPAIGRDLAAICLRALRKDPAQRPPDATALADELSAYLEGTYRGPGRPILKLAALTSTAILLALGGWLCWGPALEPGEPAGSTPTQVSDPAQPPPVDRDPYEVWAGLNADLPRFVLGQRLLRDQPEHPQAEAVRQALSELRERAGPLAELVLDPASGLTKKFGVFPTFSGAELFSADTRGVLVRWDLEQGLQSSEVQLTEGRLDAVRLLEPAEFVFSCWGDETGFGWWKAGAEPRWLLRERVQNSSLASNATQLGVIDSGGRIRLFGRKALREASQLGGLSHPPFALALSPDGRLAAAAAQAPEFLGESHLSDGELGFWDLQTGALLARIPISYHPRVICYSADSNAVFVGSTIGAVECRDARSGALRYELTTEKAGFFRARAHDGSLRGIQPLAGERLLTLARARNANETPDARHELFVWDLRERTVAHELEGLLHPPTRLSVSPELELIAVGTNMGRIVLFVLPDPTRAH